MTKLPPVRDVSTSSEFVPDETEKAPALVMAEGVSLGTT